MAIVGTRDYGKGKGFDDMPVIFNRQNFYFCLVMHVWSWRGFGVLLFGLLVVNYSPTHSYIGVSYSLLII